MIFAFIILSAAAGLIIGKLIFDKVIIGTIRVDTSDPDDNPYLFLELESDINKLKHGDVVCVVINKESYISQR